MSAVWKKCKNLFATTDLTHGPILRTILRFSAPILISYLLQNLYSMADAAICGHTLSANEVAGINDTSSIAFLFLQFAFGCTAGMSVVISRYAGKNDPAEMRRAFATQIVLSAIICLAVTVVSLFTIKPLLKLLGVVPSENAVNDAVYRAAYTYIAIICGGMAGQFFYNTICCVLRSIGDSFTPLVFLFTSTVLNIALDLLFIMGFNWGVAGAAVATVIAQVLSAAGCFIFTFAHYKQLRLRARDFKISLHAAKHMLWQGVPLGLQFSVLAFGVLTMSNGVIAFDKTADGLMVDGTPAQIGYGAACKMNNLFYTPLNALGTAVLSFCGQNDGAARHDRIRKGVTQSMLLLILLCGVLGGAGLLLTVNGAYQHLFLAADKITPQSIRYGNVYSYTVLPCMYTLGALMVLRNAVQGLGKPLCPFLAGVAELIARIVICLTLPTLLNGGPVNCDASSLSFFALSSADVVAWLAADIPLAIAAYRYVYRPTKNKRQPFPYKKILVIGCGGAGKSTFARALGTRLGLPVIHLDKLWWKPGWVERAREEFDALLKEELRRPAWIMDGNYKRTFTERLKFADYCIFLDVDEQTCLQSIHNRAEQYKGKSRPDMPEGCEERIDPEFEQWVRDFTVDVRPYMLETLQKQNVPYRVFTAREDAQQWLTSLPSA